MTTNAIELRLRTDQYLAGYTIAADNELTYIYLNGKKTGRRFSTKLVTSDELQKEVDYLMFEAERSREYQKWWNDPNRQDAAEDSREKDE